MHYKNACNTDIPGIHVCLHGIAVILQGMLSANASFHGKMAMDIVFKREKNRTQIEKKVWEF
jgi:hypothetical protein